MTGPVAEFHKRVPVCCHGTRCHGGGCQVSLEGLPTVRVIVDMEKCDSLPIPPHQKRCDYLFVGEERSTTWVAPIELKSGRLKASVVLEQIEGGVSTADAWLPPGISFNFVPVLVHGKSIHRNDLRVLRNRRIAFRGQRKGTVLIKCGDRLKKALVP